MATESEQRGLFSRLGGFFGLGRGSAAEFEERRAVPRMELRLKLQVGGVAGKLHEARLRNISPIGLFVETETLVPTGEAITVHFEGHGQEAESIVLTCRVIRAEREGSRGMGLEIDRRASGPAVCTRFRELVQHYRHHPPLLADQREGYFEGRCTGCGWLGRVGQKTARCPKCGKPVKSI